MLKPKQVRSNAKPKVDTTRKIRADRRSAFEDAAAKRMGLLNWSALRKWARECMEEPRTDQGVNNRLRLMLTALLNSIPGGDPNIPPADVAQIWAQYPYKGAEAEPPKDEAGRLAARPKLQSDGEFEASLTV